MTHSDLDSIVTHPQKLSGILKKIYICKKICLFPPTHHFLLVNSFNVQGVALVLLPQKQLIKPRFFGMDFFFQAPGIRSKVIKGTKKTNPNPTCQNS